MRRTGAVLLVVLAAGACGGGETPLSEMTDHEVTTVLSRGGLRVGVGRDGGGRLCFTYAGTRQGGGRCMVSGWAFETAVANAGPSPLLMVAFDARVAEVRIPTTDGDTFTVRPTYVPQADAHVAAITTDVHRLILSGNRAEAYDAQGQLLGREHNCTSTGGTPDCGPWTGLIDASAKPPS